MENEPKIAWLDALLRRVFHTPIPPPATVVKFAEPAFLPYEIDVVARLEGRIEELEATISQLYEANRQYVEVAQLWEGGFNAVMNFSGKLSKRNRVLLRDELRRLFGGRGPYQTPLPPPLFEIVVRFEEAA